MHKTLTAAIVTAAVAIGAGCSTADSAADTRTMDEQRIGRLPEPAGGSRPPDYRGTYGPPAACVNYWSAQIDAIEAGR